MKITKAQDRILKYVKTKHKKGDAPVYASIELNWEGNIDNSPDERIEFVLGWVGGIRPERSYHVHSGYILKTSKKQILNDFIGRYNKWLREVNKRKHLKYTCGIELP